MVRERGERPENPLPPAISPRPAPATPIDWMKIDVLEKQETLQVLLEWVPKFVVSYHLVEQIVPPCWYLHEAMIHEILAIFQYRQQQQFELSLGPPPSAPIDFQYQLSLWTGRMRSLRGDSGCTSSNHIEVEHSYWADPATTQAAMWHARAQEYILNFDTTGFTTPFSDLKELLP